MGSNPIHSTKIKDMSKLIENIIQWFLPKCPSCNTGHLHIVDEDRGKNIYECDRCNKEFI